jgi:hypothetical protein
MTMRVIDWVMMGVSAVTFCVAGGAAMIAAENKRMLTSGEVARVENLLEIGDVLVLHKDWIHDKAEQAEIDWIKKMLERHMEMHTSTAEVQGSQIEINEHLHRRLLDVEIRSELNAAPSPRPE